MEKMTIREWIPSFLNGDFDKPDRDTQISAGWYDWFCKDKSLANKTKKLGKKLIQIVKSKKINIDKTYILLKNNCPCEGNLYDDFRICDIETNDVVYTVTPSSGFTVSKGVAEVWGKENNFDGPLVTGTWNEIKEWFLK